MKKFFSNIFAAVSLLIGTSLLVTACSENNDDAIVEAPEATAEYIDVPYTVTVNSGNVTRATVDDDGTDLHFSEGDKLFLEGWISGTRRCYGTLELTSGAGEQEATFFGYIRLASETPSSQIMDIDYVLVGATDCMSVWDHSLVVGRNTPHITADMTEAVEKYSNIFYHTNQGFKDTNFQLAQRNAFMSFSLGLPTGRLFIDTLKKISVSFTKSDESKVEISTPEDYSHTIDPSKYLKFVVPFDVAKEISGEDKITAIHVDLTTDDDRIMSVDVPCGDGGKALNSGRVYNVKMEVPNNITNPKVGEILKFGSIEGMVIDLPKYGRKAVIALDNLGVNDEDTDRIGQKVTYEEAWSLCPNEWHIPWEYELIDFAETYPTELIISGSTQFTVHHIVEDRDLIFPFAISGKDNREEGKEPDSFYDYWTDTQELPSHTPDSYRTFGYKYFPHDDGTTTLLTASSYDNIQNKYYVRLIHHLKE